MKPDKYLETYLNYCIEYWYKKNNRKIPFGILYNIDSVLQKSYGSFISKSISDEEMKLRLRQYMESKMN